MKNIHVRLQAVMDVKNINHQQLADAIESKRPTVSRWLKGKPEPSRSSCIRIASATGCNFEWLWEGKGEMMAYIPPSGNQVNFNLNQKEMSSENSEKAGTIHPHFPNKSMQEITLWINEQDDGINYWEVVKAKLAREFPDFKEWLKKHHIENTLDASKKLTSND